MSDASESRGEIFIVDDDPAVRQVLVAVFARSGYQLTCFAEGNALLVAARARTPVCIILDVHIPGRSGLEILKDLNAQEYPAPIFIISGQGDIPMAVEAIKGGALDFIEKPFRGSEIVERVETAVTAWGSRRSAGTPSIQFPGRQPLTPRERDVLAHVVAGASNKEAARGLGISPRTVEVHRARIMEKLDARNVADLMRIVMNEGRGSMLDVSAHQPSQQTYPQ
jgi:FixJ family two-component response regulator